MDRKATSEEGSLLEEFLFEVLTELPNRWPEVTRKA
jgi:hypothetical protein